MELIKQGFSLIEMAVVLLIVGIMLSIGIPMLNRRSVDYIGDFVIHLNRLVSNGVSMSAQDNKVAKIVIYLQDPKKIELEIENKVIEMIDINSKIEFLDFTINGKNEIGIDKIWFFILPNGTTQEVLFSLKDDKHKQSLVLNPFMGKFKLKESE